MLGDRFTSFHVYEKQLRDSGYYCSFSCTYDGGAPDDFKWTGKESGWEMRRKLKKWASEKGVSDFKIVRNTSWVRDLHGIVYELWVPHTKATMVEEVL
jgi:hypothetical protein